jgi:mono/diheme cytochrome c family protein
MVKVSYIIPVNGFKRFSLALAVASVCSSSIRSQEARREDPRIGQGSVGARRAVASTRNVQTNQGKALEVYRTLCLECHDSDGRGALARDVMKSIPDLTDAKWHMARSDQQISHSILEGKGKFMPSMKKKLRPGEVEPLIAFIRGFRGGGQVVPDDDKPVDVEPPSATPLPATAAPVPTKPESRPSAEVIGLFRRHCVPCHGKDGRGAAVRATMPRIPDLSLHSWNEARSDARLVVSIREGKGAQMPPFRARLADAQIQALVAYVRTFDPSHAKPAASSLGEFDRQFRNLEQELNDLGRKYRELRPESQRGTRRD